MVCASAIAPLSISDRRRSRGDPPLAAGLSFLLGPTLNQLSLLFVHRMRPYDAGITHLLIARSARSLVPLRSCRGDRRLRGSFSAARGAAARTLVLAATLLVIVSRVYIGTQYASDILGGTLTGVFGILLVRALFWQGTRADRLIAGIL